jgi:multidrug efflux pump subunit AcrB
VTVPSAKHRAVPLRDLVELQASSGPASIFRDHRHRQVTVTAKAALGYGQNDVQAVLEKVVADINLPSGYEVRASGFTQEGGKTARAFIVALLLSVVFMYLVGRIAERRR